MAPRNFRGYRTVALSAVFTTHSMAVPGQRARYTSLMFLLACVWLLNGLQARPDDKKSCRELMQYAFFLTPRAGANTDFLPYPASRIGLDDLDFDPDDETLDLDQVHSEEWLPHIPYGVTFFQGFRMEEGTAPRFNMGRERSPLSEKAWHFFFKIPASAISARFFGTGVVPNSAIEGRVIGNRVRLTAHFRTTPEEEYLPNLFNLGETSQVSTQLEPLDDGSEMDEDEPPEERDVDAKLSSIWYQYSRDILTKTPNPRGAQPSYCRLTKEERQVATDEVFKDRDLARYWRMCTYKVATREDWDRAFGHLWPMPETVVAGRVQNYATCRYWIEWRTFSQRLSANQLEVARLAIRAKMDRLQWWPNAAQDRIWVSKYDRTGHFVHADPALANSEVPAPQLLVRFTPQWTMQMVE